MHDQIQNPTFYKIEMIIWKALGFRVKLKYIR